MRKITFISLISLAAAAFSACSNSLPLARTNPSPRVANAMDLGPVAPGEVIDLVFGIRVADPIHLHQFLTKQPLTGDSMSPSDFGDAFGVSGGEYARIVTWLRAQGFTITRTAAGRTEISASATADVVARAFGTEIHQFVDSDGRFVASLGALSFAPEVAPSVSGVVGLDGEFPWHSHAFIPQPQAQPAAAPKPFGAPQLETQYSTTAITSPGMGQTIVILGAGGPPAMTDVSSYITTYKPYGQTTLPGTYTQDLVGGPDRTGDTPDGEQLENTLDIEMVVAMAPYAKIIHVITATNAGGLFADGITHIINTYPDAHQVTVSYGSCERGSAAEMPVLNALFQQAMAQGQQWFFASGDDGTDGCRNGAGNTVASAGWPASSPYVVGVGGTQINTAAAAGKVATELAWNSWSAGMTGIPGATGGGASESLDKPAFQMGVTPDDGARDEPDVSALAGPPYVNIYEEALTTLGAPSAITQVAGTSAATPMWAGVWALIEQGKSNPTITNGLTELYTLGKTAATATSFQDVTSTTNSSGGQGDTTAGGYVPAAGYDLATGWGTPNVPNLIKNWQ